MIDLEKMQWLSIMRHGEAEWSASSDKERILTSFGVAQVESVAKKLDLPETPTFYASPYIRAQQTLDVLINSLKLSDAITKTEDLITPDADVRLTTEWINAINHDHIFLVSHMPMVADLVYSLTQDTRIGGFNTAQVVQLRRKDTAHPWQLSAIYAADQNLVSPH